MGRNRIFSQTDARATNQQDIISQGLVRCTRLQIGLHGYETAVRFLHGQEWPKQTLEKVLVELFFAHTLMEYYEVYHREINRREKTVSAHTIDLKAWTRDQISEKIMACFENAISYQALMNQAMPEFYREFFICNNYPAQIRPVLRDAITYIAVKHLADSKYWTPQAANEVYKVNIKALANQPRKLPVLIDKLNTHPLEKLAYWLSEHSKFHLLHNRPAAALEAQYVLIDYLHGHAHDSGIREELITTLSNLQKYNRQHEWWSRGQALLAELIQQQKKPGALIEAKNTAALGIEAYPLSHGAKLCTVTIEVIEHPKYSLDCMALDGLQKKSLLVKYKNISKLYFRAYELNLEKWLNKKFTSQFGVIRNPREFISSNKNAPIFTWEENLEPTLDYAFHRHVIIPTINKNGMYFIVSSTREDFYPENNSLCGVTLLISDLVLIEDKPDKATYEFKVLNGETGLPQPEVKITLYSCQREQNLHVVNTKETDKNGNAQFNISPTTNRHLNYFILAGKQGSYSIKDNINYILNEDPQDVKESLLFTDRSIYRPGQKILWKIIGYEGIRKSGAFRTLQQGTILDVNLHDPNDQVVGQQSIKLNAYGTGSGEFIIPTGRLLGQWNLRVNAPYYGTTGIRVEEYKRPTFEVSVTEAPDEIRLNHSARLRGEAKYYFGSPVSSGKIN
ncbi:MAG: hypothetical protein HY080_03740 [Gammaproteobacteria bacterium]|nr:hypothetical protein [Gammaproteobacteria bacterium]